MSNETRDLLLEVTMSKEYFLKPYRGGKDDLSVFWSKFMVIAGLQEWDDDDKKMSN